MPARNLQFVVVPCGYIVQYCRNRGLSTRKSSGSGIHCGRSTQDGMSKLMNNAG